MEVTGATMVKTSNVLGTESCLELPGGGGSKTEPVTPKGFSETEDLKLNVQSKETVDLNESILNGSPKEKNNPSKPPAKAVGWPPVLSYRKTVMAQKNTSEEGGEKVSGSGADGAPPYLRKSYQELSDTLTKMFTSFSMGPSDAKSAANDKPCAERS